MLPPCAIFALQIHHNTLADWGSLQRSPDPLAGFGEAPHGREGEGRGGKENRGEGRESEREGKGDERSRRGAFPTSF